MILEILISKGINTMHLLHENTIIQLRQQIYTAIRTCLATIIFYVTTTITIKQLNSEMGFWHIVDMETLKCSAPRGISPHDKGCPIEGYGLQITVSGIRSSQIASPAITKRIQMLCEMPPE